MRRRFLIAFFALGLISLFSPPVAWGAKKRPPRGSGEAAPRGTAGRSYSRGVQASVNFRSDRRGLLINFSDFGQAVSVTYTLTYTSNGVPQGAMGSVTSDTAGQQRELLFGTCSAGICRYHTNITNARLVIDSKLSSGLTIRKPYRIKI